MRFFIVACYLVIVFLLLKNIVNSGIPFWFDPARDLLLAQDNLSKPTLIGQYTGIPGLFYGPYWIWLLSLCLTLSMDPVFITIVVLTIPFLTIFPLLLYFLRNTSGKVFWFIQYLLFITAFTQYATSLWNPHPAFIITLFLIFLVSLIDTQSLGKKNIVLLFLVGLCVGFIINFHFSFGLGVGFGTALYLLIKYFRKLYIIVPILFCGFIITFIPFLAFEYRHGFNQLRALKDAVINAAIYNSASVGQTGMNHIEISKSFIFQLNRLLHTQNTNYLFQIFVFILFVYFIISLFYRFSDLSKDKKRVVAFSVICLGGVYFMYQTSKNPVWDYHFAGVEIFYLVLIGVISASNKKLKILISVVACFFLILQFINEFRLQNNNPLSIPSLYTKKYITDIIINDSDPSFSYAAYSSAIYTYDYDYLFKWRLKSFDKQLDTDQYPKVKYLIIPPTNEAVFQDFINYKTPDDKYITENIWNIPDGTTIVKRRNILTD